MRPRDTAGFTLIEVVVVCTVVGLLLTFSLPAIRRYTRDISLSGGTEQVTTALRLARFKAVASHANVIMRFQWPDGTYSMHTDANGDGVVEPGEPVRGPYHLPRSITFENADTEPVSGDSLIFRPNGTLAAGGTLVVRSPSASKRVTVLSSTGGVWVQ